MVGFNLESAADLPNRSSRGGVTSATRRPRVAPTPTWGVVTLTESCVHGQAREQPVARARYDEMVARIRDDLRPFCARHGIGGRVARGEVQMIGASGTVTTREADGPTPGVNSPNRNGIDRTITGGRYASAVLAGPRRCHRHRSS